MTERRPNILWISTHDINPDLGAYAGVWPGAEVAHTPHLDALAAGGVRFDHAFATTPVCAPSRSALMTGCYPTSIGTHNMRTKAVPPPEVRLLPEYLRMQGYYATNNWFTDLQVHLPGTAFDECSPTAHWRGRPDPETPFFAVFHGMTTHESQLYLADDEFDRVTEGLPRARRHDPASVPVPPFHLDDDVFRTAWARYHDLVSVMDAWVGELLRQLADDGLEDDTIVVFWSDHGAGFPRMKRAATEAGLRVPLIIRWPARLTGGAVRTDVVHLADLGPTMLTMAGIPVPDHMQFSPLFDADGHALRQGSYTFGGRDRMDEQHDSSRTVRDDRFRLIRHRHPDRSPLQYQHFADRFPTWRSLRTAVNAEARQRAAGYEPHHLTPLQRRVTAPGKPDVELYDIVADPHETRDLAGDPEYADILARLDAALDEWLDRVGDLGTVPEDELAERWRPSGVEPHTAAPIVDVVSPGVVALSCETPGALVGWRTDPPEPERELTLQQRINGDPIDPIGWCIATGPITIPDGATLWARAWRLGIAPSPTVTVRADTLAGGILRAAEGAER